MSTLSKSIKSLKRKLKNSLPFNSQAYWEKRYEGGEYSGVGSRNEWLEYKASVVNKFVEENNISSVIEYGCGDGHQLSAANYKTYVGFDVSKKAVELCRERFQGDNTKEFKEIKDYDNETADLTLSLEVIFHLVEDSVFEEYMNRLIDSSNKFILIFSSNSEKFNKKRERHEKHRFFADWIEKNKKNIKQIAHIKNKEPYNFETGLGSMSDFYMFKKES